MTEPISRFSTVETIGRGVEAAPVLRSGFGLTLGLAMVGAAGRVALPILVQQAIDRGFSTTGDGVSVDVRTVWVLGALALVATTIATFAQRAAVRRLGVRSEEALYGLRVRLFEHIHRLSIADHNEERKGALVARVTSDVETLAMFFSWGALAWLLDGMPLRAYAATLAMGNSTPLSPYQAIAADFDQNGKVELTDAIGVLKMVVGLNAPSPTWTYYDDAKLTLAYQAAESLNPEVWTTTAAVADASSVASSVKLVGVLAGDVDGSWSG